MRLLKSVLLLWFVALAACGDSSQGGSTVAIRDSAGVRIFEASADTARIPTWPVDALPSAVLDEELFQVRAIDHLASGGFVVAHQSQTELRFYSADGHLLRTVGRAGEGPGEFRFILDLQTLGDSVWVHDLQNARVTVFDSNGRVLRTIPLLDKGRPFSEGVFDDGSLLLARAEVLPPVMGPRVDSRRFYRLSRTGTLSDFGNFRTSESYNAPIPEGGFVMLPVPYGRNASAAALPGEASRGSEGPAQQVRKRDSHDSIT